MKRIMAIFAVSTAFLMIAACSEKVSQPRNLPEPGSILPDTTYVMVTPAWTEADGIPFNKPSDVKIGYDRYVYVADRDNDRIVKLSLAGEFIESYVARYPTQIAQDRALDLLAVSDSSVILKRSYSEGGDFFEVYVWPDVIQQYPLPSLLPSAIFGIAASPFPDKSYLISNFYDNTCFFDSIWLPDSTLNEDSTWTYDTILVVDTICFDMGIYKFDSDGNLGESQIPVGFDVGMVAYPVCINTFDFYGNYLIGYTTSNTFFSAQIVDAVTGQPFIPRSDSADIYRGIEGGHKDIAMDHLGNVFVCTRKNSQVWKFSRYGVLQLKFGQDGGPGGRLNGPGGIDIYQNHIYIADTDNNRIVRFEISTSVQQ